MVCITTDANHLNSLFTFMRINYFSNIAEVGLRIRNMNQVRWNILYSTTNRLQIPPVPDSTCVICDERGDCILLDCRHSVCFNCAVRMQEFLNHVCPVCRGMIRFVYYNRNNRN